MCVPEDCPSLVEYLRSFDISLKVLQYPYALTRCVYEICEDAYKDGVSYIEIRFAPILHTEKGCTLSEILHAVVEGREMAVQHFPITCRIIVCAMRQLSPAESLNAAEAAFRYQHKGVVALDVAGPEKGFMPDEHKEAFALARTKGLSVTVHAGEAAGWESIDHAIRHCGAQRLGHGVALRDKPDLLEKVINSGIAVETCPTSNIQTKAVQSMEDHPVKMFFDKGVVIVPCTDNTTVSNVTLSGEYLRLHKEKGFAVEEIVRMIDYGFKSAFISYSHRVRLRLEAMQKVLTYLQKEGFDISGILYDLPLYDRIFYRIMPEKAGPIMYWDKTVNPQLTPEIVRLLPKVDLHVRFVGGMSLDHLWEESVKAGKGNRLVKELKTKEEMLEKFKNIIHPQHGDSKSERDEHGELKLTTQDARHYMIDVLQSKDQIKLCMDDIYRISKEDGIVYLELMIRPRDHTNGGLTEDEVVETVVETKKEVEKKYNIRSSIFLSCRVPDDDPYVFMETAKRILKYRSQGVIGFSTFGEDINDHDMQFFVKTFWFLKQHNVPVVLSSARSAGKNIIPGIIDAGAIRISGGYTVEKQPHIVKFLSDRQIPVDLSVTRHMKEHSKDMHSFAGNVIRFLIDNDVKVLLCSIGRNLEMYPTLVECISKVVVDCGIKVHELVEILSNGFRCTALPLAEREKMYREYIIATHEILTKNGFRHFWKKAILADYYKPFPEPHPLLKDAVSNKPDKAENTVITPGGEKIHVEGGSSMMMTVQ